MAGSQEVSRKIFIALGITAGAGLAAWLVYRTHLARLEEQDRRQQELLQEYERILLPGAAEYLKIKDDFIKEMRAGLERQGGSSLMQLPTYVTQLPDGTERGSCYAIDLGGTNFRALYVRLGEATSHVEHQKLHEVKVPAHLYDASGRELFDWMATCLAGFMAEDEREHRMAPGSLPVVGFCFSFAMEQRALDCGIMLGWTKGYKCEGVVGRDVVALLTESLERAGRPCHVAAVMNDTIGVWAAGRYLDPNTEIGIIMGTGTNACYVERIANIPKLAGSGLDPAGATVINIEWGSLAHTELPRCQEDIDLDAEDPSHSGHFHFEKMMSGLYLGQVVQRILHTFARRTRLFGPVIPERLATPGFLTTPHVATMEQDAGTQRLKTAWILVKELEVDGNVLTPRVLALVQGVCRLVAKRSAYLCATGLLAILEQQGFTASPHRVTVAIDGGMYDNYKGWRVMLVDAMRDLLGSRADELLPLLHFRDTQDGSCLGAAVIAAAAVKNAAAGARSPKKSSQGATAAAADVEHSKQQGQQQAVSYAAAAAAGTKAEASAANGSSGGGATGDAELAGPATPPAASAEKEAGRVVVA